MSVQDKGTLFQLKQLVNRSAVHADPGKDLKAAEDFFMTVWDAHIVAAAQCLMSSQSFSSVSTLSRAIIDEFVVLPSATSVSQPASRPKSTDQVFVYALDVLNLGLIYHGFHDAVREGDGDRVVVYWKALMIAFKAAQRRNYSKEAFLFLLQLQTCSERVAEQIVWGRFVNRKGRVGCNVSCDLALEHLNRRVKTVLHHLGANIRDSTIVRAGKSIGVVDTICSAFEDSLEVAADAGCHRMPSDEKDFRLILETLLTKDVFKQFDGRTSSHFHNSCTLLEQVDRSKLLEWLNKLLKELNLTGYLADDSEHDDSDV